MCGAVQIFCRMVIGLKDIEVFKDFHSSRLSSFNSVNSIFVTLKPKLYRDVVVMEFKIRETEVKNLLHS